ncbi:hypothetical protein NLG97_g6506 [Lecanicillium saksenae]|uniref:Uncharacterized protein n=1 Tax=Lecanicillium saksenae TaxID=468837 RepID=A0ACC1QPG3_9HYPO|nr:hypothetical protein NLG97_g6506 [Lecanicillium saksenae]
MSESSLAVARTEVAQERSPQGHGELARCLPAEMTGDLVRLPHAAAGEKISKAVTKPRVRRHTSRATTGCSTCKECDMHTPLLWRSKRGETQIAHERASLFTSSTHAPQSLELPVSIWSPSQRASTMEDDWVQACYHWGTLYRRIHPERRITKQMPFSAELTGFVTASDPMKLVMILVSLAALLLEERPGAPNYTNLTRRPDLATYIKKYNDYNTVVLSSLSRDIHNLSPASRVLNRLGNFIQSEIVLNSPTLPLHLKGFATILSVRGGIRTVLERNEASSFVINNTLIATTALNTTSPAKACISSATCLVDDHAYLLYTSNLLENFPCPTQLYRCIVDINWLRAQQAAGQLDGVCDASAAIAAAIQGFNPENWNERPNLRSSEVRCLIAQLYQSATDLASKRQTTRRLLRNAWWRFAASTSRWLGR